MDEHISKRAAAEQAVASWESEGGAETAAPASEKRLAGTESSRSCGQRRSENECAVISIRVAAALRAVVVSRQSGEDLARQHGRDRNPGRKAPASHGQCDGWLFSAQVAGDEKSCTTHDRC